MKKILTEEQIKEYEQRMRGQYPGHDTFFVSSAACDAGLSKRTIQNYIYSGNSDFSFINLREPEVPDGGIATCQSSMQACGAKRRENDGRKNLETWKTNFRQHVTDTSPGSAVSGGIMKTDSSSTGGNNGGK